MIVVAPVVLAKENLDAAPRGLDGVRVVPGVWIDEMGAVVDCAVRETLRVEIAVRTQAFADDRFAWFDTGFTDIFHHFLQGSTRTKISPPREVAVKTGKGSVLHCG
jgi:hypothetical protein